MCFNVVEHRIVYRNISFHLLEERKAVRGKTNICEDEEAAIYVCSFVQLVSETAISMFSELRCMLKTTLKKETSSSETVDCFC